MKKKLIIIMIMITTGLFALKNWKVYTNTTHIFDIIETGNELNIATWGGLLDYNLNNNSFGETLTTIDGLGNNDIRVLDYLESSNQILVGTANNGINRISNNVFLTPLTETLGLQSNIVNKIVHNDSLIFVATKLGVSCFKDDPDFPFPLLLNNYDTGNGLSANNITSLQISDNGYIFCGSENGIDIVHIDSMNVESNWRHFNVDNSIFPSSIINDISVMNNYVAIGTRGGLVVSSFPPFEWIVYDDIIENHVSSLYPVYINSAQQIIAGVGYWDEEKMIVVDSTDIAAFKFSNGQIQELWYADDMNLSNTQIMGFKEVEETLVAFTWGEGILFYDGIDWSLPKKTNSLLSNTIKDMVFDKQDKLWITDGHKGSSATSKGTKGVSSFDGDIWQNYNAEKTDLRSNNIYSICVDEDNRKWFGAWSSNSSQNWQGGISVFDDVNNVWDYVTVANGIGNNTISFLTVDEQNRTWVCSYGGSSAYVTILDNNFDYITSFELFEPLDPNDMDPNYIFIGEEKIYFGGWISGLRIWNDTTDPITNGANWSKTPFTGNLQSGRIFDITSRNINNEEIWIASGHGLFMYDGIDWFWFGTTIKKKVWFDNHWFWNEDNPDPEYWYYEGQERLYGSISTYPTALFVDPFGMVWIGTQDAGITIFDTSRDKFINLTTENTPLISNTITDLAYEPKTGTLYIGTNLGMNSVEIGISAEMNEETDLFETIVYPNPFYPENGDILRIENRSAITMPKGNTYCRIFDLNGDIVMEIEKDIYEQFSWDGLNKTGKKCGSGIYLYVVSAPNGQTSKGKIALIR
ncbi:MAG: T9SS type A sorting domain-containing protein [Candidatus Cloacimonadota bacterium]|nr:T9SS type A sorting domain-containing protein [Candidatus Cloacimonadota bacterium]